MLPSPQTPDFRFPMADCPIPERTMQAIFSGPAPLSVAERPGIVVWRVRWEPTDLSRPWERWRLTVEGEF